MEPTANISIFEGMFVRGLKPEGKFAEELRAAGYDPKKPELNYPVQVWRNALEIARRHCYPQLPPDQGMRQLGRRFVDGFFDTIAGKFMAVAMPLIGQAAVVKRLPKYWAVGRTGVSIDMQQEGERQWRVIYREANPSPDFVAGIIEGSSKYTKTNLTVEIPVRSSNHFEMVVRW